MRVRFFGKNVNNSKFSIYFYLHSKAKCTYGVPNSNPVARKSFTFRNKNNNKTQGDVKLFLVTEFEFVYAITALYYAYLWILAFSCELKKMSLWILKYSCVILSTQIFIKFKCQVFFSILFYCVMTYKLYFLRPLSIHYLADLLFS